MWNRIVEAYCSVRLCELTSRLTLDVMKKLAERWGDCWAGCFMRQQKSSILLVGENRMYFNCSQEFRTKSSRKIEGRLKVPYNMMEDKQNILCFKTMQSM